MLYPQNFSPQLNMELFRNPTKEYRGAPFWAWNCELSQELLERQIRYIKKMGFGGFHIHSRSGMATEYLSDDFMNLIEFCCKKASENDMLTWLYDEDRYPSGAAGGFVTKHIPYRMKQLLFTEEKLENSVSPEDGLETGLPSLLACYAITLNDDGTLASYRVIDENDTVPEIKRYAYVLTQAPFGWYNNQSYLDTLNPEAVAKFLEITHECYKRKLGNEFGKNIPAIFTDEPRFEFKQMLTFADGHEDRKISWTYDLPKTFSQAYGLDLTEHLPEIFWDLPDNCASRVRYLYYEHLIERFCSSYIDQYGKWCEENGIAMTGHSYGEECLNEQTMHLGDVMRTYRGFTIPGIDILKDGVELNTTKQAQSAKHQYGREAMTSELYGVTGWEFDFRGHKFQGDWQAALGVNIRVPHLTWASMKGSAKRDYPASINYQSPWYEKYSYVENHFARLNTVLTRGTPIVKVGVIHPIETYWLHYGPMNTSSDIRKKLEHQFEKLTKILLTDMIDFDFINEALLPDLCGEITDELTVGKMSYSVVIVPDCETLRSSTLEILRKFYKAGGKVVFLGSCPKYIDAISSDAALSIYQSCQVLPMEKTEIYSALKKYAVVTVFDKDGNRVKDLISAYRQDNDCRYLFLAHCEKTTSPDDKNEKELFITLSGTFEAIKLDTMTGEALELNYYTDNGKTHISVTLYAHDSLLLKLSPIEQGCNHVPSTISSLIKTIDFKEEVSFQRVEDNVYLLDLAKYRLDDGELQDTEEMLRIDSACREILDYPKANGEDVQPWVLGKESIEHYVTLYFDINCECELENTRIALEEVEEIICNNESVSLVSNGYFVDESILTYSLPTLRKGVNQLCIKVPITKRIGLENGFLLGDFDVAVNGCKKTLAAPSRKISFGSITHQGMPFYGGNLVYSAKIETPDCNLTIRANQFRSSLLSVRIDGKDAGIIAYAPYNLNVNNVSKGVHTIEIIHYGNRHNTFGWLHNCGYDTWYGPSMWYSTDYSFCYEYCLKDTGILSSPVIEVYQAT